MPHILVTNHYDQGPHMILEQVLPDGFSLELLKRADRDELLLRIPRADYLLVSGRIKIDQEILRAGVNVKMIQRTGVGVDILDFQALKEQNIPVYVNEGVNAISVAEHAVMLMLACLRRLPEVDKNMKNGIWEKQAQGILTGELSGKTVGLIGMGHIGRKVAELLAPFHVKLLYYKPNRMNPKEERKLGLSYRNLEALAKESDLISLHCPLKPETYKMIDGKMISQMKRTAVLVNTARGQLIDEKALVKALQGNKIAFAGLDVFEQEPPGQNWDLASLKNVILTPHIGGVTNDSFRRMMSEAMKNIQAFDQGRMKELESKRLKL